MLICTSTTSTGQAYNQENMAGGLEDAEAVQFCSEDIRHALALLHAHKSHPFDGPISLRNSGSPKLWRKLPAPPPAAAGLDDWPPPEQNGNERAAAPAGESIQKESQDEVAQRGGWPLAPRQGQSSRVGFKRGTILTRRSLACGLTVNCTLLQADVQNSHMSTCFPTLRSVEDDTQHQLCPAGKPLRLAECRGGARF